MSPVRRLPAPVRRSSAIAPARRFAAAHGVVAVGACCALAGSALVGCGSSDDAPSETDTARATAPKPRTAPAVSATAAELGVVLEGSDQGLLLWLQKPEDGSTRRLRATVQVTSTATTAVRQRLAETAAIELHCNAVNNSQGVIVDAQGPRRLTLPGHRISFGTSFKLRKGFTPAELRFCELSVAPERRGRAKVQTFDGNPKARVATFRFR